MRFTASFAFWSALGMLAYTFVGYRFLIAWLASRRPKLQADKPADLPSICALIVAYNEEERIAARVENLLSSDYPPEKLRVLVVSDGSTDSTAEQVERIANARATVLRIAPRKGKAAGLNAGISSMTEEIVVLTDSRQQFSTDTVARLAAHFADPAIGAASGSLEIHSAASSTGQGIGAYWKLEKVIRAAESRWDSCIGCTGAVYAIRRSQYEAIPEDTVLDDVVIPMTIASKGSRVLHDPAAIAIDPQPLDPAVEQRRKRRTLAGNFQMLFRYPHWLMPWRSRLWWQLLSHKYLRLTAPLWLATSFLANLMLLGLPFYRLAFFAQLAIYGFAMIGIRFPAMRGKLFAFPAGFVFLNFTTVQAFWHYLISADLHQWQTVSHRK